LTSLDESHHELFASAGLEPESLAEGRELADRLRAVWRASRVATLPQVTMVTHLDFTPSQVADALGVTPGAAKVIVHRARRRLRNALAWS